MKKKERWAKLFFSLYAAGASAAKQKKRIAFVFFFSFLSSLPFLLLSLKGRLVVAVVFPLFFCHRLRLIGLLVSHTHTHKTTHSNITYS